MFDARLLALTTLQPGDDQLRKAASEGNLSILDEALIKGAEANVHVEFGDTALNETAEVWKRF